MKKKVENVEPIVGFHLSQDPSRALALNGMVHFVVDNLAKGKRGLVLVPERTGARMLEDDVMAILAGQGYPCTRHRSGRITVDDTGGSLDIDVVSSAFDVNRYQGVELAFLEEIGTSISHDDWDILRARVRMVDAENPTWGGRWRV